MKIFKEIASFNNYIGLPKPHDTNIDIGYYNPQDMLLKSDPVTVDFYRISIKSNFISKLAADYNPDKPKPITAVFFNSPGIGSAWDVEPTYNGIYLQLSKKIIEEHRYLFKNYLDYGEHEALYLTPAEEQEVRTIFGLMFNYYGPHSNHEVLLSYAHVLISLVEAFYKRQFSTHPKQYSHILANFQQLLKDYYNEPATQLPTVQYFATQLNVTPNYLGDIVKHFTKKSALETIHDLVIKKAKLLLEDKAHLNSSEIAYQLGFEYPNYFSKFFKKHLAITPRQYRLQALKKQHML